MMSNKLLPGKQTPEIEIESKNIKKMRERFLFYKIYSCEKNKLCLLQFFFEFLTFLYFDYQKLIFYFYFILFIFFYFLNDRFELTLF